jgi:hypothetical protein
MRKGQNDSHRSLTIGAICMSLQSAVFYNEGAGNGKFMIEVMLKDVSLFLYGAYSVYS